MSDEADPQALPGAHFSCAGWNRQRRGAPRQPPTTNAACSMLFFDLQARRDWHLPSHERSAPVALPCRVRSSRQHPRLVRQRARCRNPVLRNDFRMAW